MILGIEKTIQAECLIAFAHSRIIGLAGQGQEGVEIFSKKAILKEAIACGDEVSDAIKELATIEMVKHKISTSTNFLIQSSYFNNYNKLKFLMDKHIKKDEELIEGLIGLYLLKYAAEHKIINSDNLEYFNYAIELYTNIEDSEENKKIVETVKRMKNSSREIFDDYLRKKKKVANKKNKRRKK